MNLPDEPEAGPSTPPRTPAKRRASSTERRRSASGSYADRDPSSTASPRVVSGGGGDPTRSAPVGMGKPTSFAGRPSGRKWVPTLEPLDTRVVSTASAPSVSSPRHAEHHVIDGAVSFTTARSPIAGEGESVARRRTSISNPSTNPVSRRRVSNAERSDMYPRTSPAPSSATATTAPSNIITQGPLDHQAGPSGTAGPTVSRPFGWLANTINAPLDHKRSKSDDDLQRDDTDWDSTPREQPMPTNRRERRAKSKRHRNVWTEAPSISMTPPTTADVSSGFTSISMEPSFALPSLPVDPYNLLPLSTASTPPISSRATPIPSPQAWAAEASDYVSVHTHNPSASGGGSASPRTSMSTSSSHFGWGVPRSFSESSTGEDDDSPTNPSTWWWRSHPRPPPSILPRPAPIRPSSRIMVIGGLRRWGWLLGPLRGVFERRSEAEMRYLSRRRPRREDREKIMTRRRRHPETVCGSKMLGTGCAYVKTKPWTVSFYLACFATFALVVTLTIMHILNPDKEALPWRGYCTANYPTLYSLQPSAVSESVNWQSHDVALAPIPPGHHLWPYPGHTGSPYAEDLASTHLDDQEPVSVLVGVFTVDAGVDRRNLIRQSYATHWRSRKPGTEGVRVRFVMGRPRAKYANAVALEAEAFNDIIFLDIPENMNAGKTHAFFSWAAQNATVPDWEYPSHPRSPESEAEFKEIAAGGTTDPLAPVFRGERKPDYVVKADDDSFIMLGELERKLRATPRTKAYWGYLVRNLFMAGECYALSRDLVDYVATTPRLRTMTKGKEDKLVSKWMRLHPEREEITWATERCWIYDHPRAGTVYSHGFLFPNEVATVRAEQDAGLPPAIARGRGGTKSDAYSTVSKFGKRYRPPVAGLSGPEQVEALIEGSGVSKLRDDRSALARQNPRDRLSQLMSVKPTRSERFLDDSDEHGGTTVVHYIKRDEWYVETVAALLGDREHLH